MFRSRKLLGSLFIACALQVSASPIVNIGLEAAFKPGPYLIELLETAAGENSTSYFPLLDRIATGHFSSVATEAELYRTFVDILYKDGHVTSPEALSTFNLALSLRAAAPRVEAHYQYYETAIEPILRQGDECLEWVLLDDSRYCTPSLDVVHEKLSLRSMDTLFDRKRGSGKDAILYADPTSKNFGLFHSALSGAAAKHELTYRLRYRRAKQGAETLKPLSVSGYGVELALKRTDYIVIDDRESNLPNIPNLSSSNPVLESEEDVADLKPLSTSELADLGLKAGSFIMKSDEPLDTLVKLTQDFPRISSSIASMEVAEDYAAEHKKNREHRVPGGINHLWINGAQIIDRQIQPFTLVDIIRRERKMVDSVRELGFSAKQAVALLGHEAVIEAKSNDESPRYDWTDGHEDGHAIIWMNDLEKDEMYSDYPKHLKSLLQRTYPGQIPPIARNIFNIILPVDMSDKEDLSVVTQITGLMKRGIPVRFGLVPLVASPSASEQARITYYLSQHYGADVVTEYLRGFHEGPEIEDRNKIFAVATRGSKIGSDSVGKTPEEILQDTTLDSHIASAAKWANRLGVGSGASLVFADGFPISRDKTWMQALSMKLAEDLQLVQKAVYKGELEEDSWPPEILLKNSVKTRNNLISPEDGSLHFLDVNKLHSGESGILDQVPLVEAEAEAARENWATATVVADLTSEEGLGFLFTALSFRRNHPGVRLDIVHNAYDTEEAARINKALKENEKALAVVHTREQLVKLLQDSTGAGDAGLATSLTEFLEFTKIPAGTRAIILNGRVVGPVPPGEEFSEEAFQQLLEFELKNRILPVYAAVEDLGLGAKLSDPLAAAKVTSLVALSTISELPEGIFESASTLRTTMYDAWGSDYTAIESGNADKSSVHIVGLLNPLSEQGQRWASILKVIAELDGIYLKLFINPKDKIEELPIKQFFRYVLQSKPLFDEDGNVQGSNATFKGLPREALLNVALNVPPAWLVSPKVSLYDLDNIKLASTNGDNVDAIYELEHILIEGHSREGKGKPPKGAQLALATGNNPMLTDTTVMANLGFFQFKANPGVYNIDLKEGHSSNIYTIESVGANGYAPINGGEGTDVTLMDFQGTTLYPRLIRKPGMEDADIFKDPNDKSEHNILSKGLKLAGDFFAGTKQKTLSAQEHAEINIFSVASGHLYERMLNIMIVSVMKNTKQTVKFWFIEQFLSPSFKEFIPHLADEYGFKYEMVTYKWPHWLRQQKEKQREIWGYKILFLDVLFPLSLDKIIFVDADQVVRTDMMDLVNHDLQDAPYGFTPMCDSRTEMEGFRFWKQGYWVNYLKGLPYHISALYVVDLRRFRELAAGDRLRQQYQALSADPNSLSNLDQDLPNHMQFQIPIHSLPQEWLWCETWCSDDSLAQARTIDLCNNPETKEPKLDRARRQVPEWTSYDNEIAALDKRIKVEQAKVDINTKSRRFEEEPVHTIDEL